MKEFRIKYQVVDSNNDRMSISSVVHYYKSQLKQRIEQMNSSNIE